MLALDSILCTSNDVELPASTLGLSTPTPNTFLESTIHCAASLDNPGKLKKKMIYLTLRKINN